MQAAVLEGMEARLLADPGWAVLHLLERSLVPGELSLKALSLALEEMGKDVAASELKSKSKEEVLTFLVEVGELAQRGADGGRRQSNPYSFFSCR